MAYSKLHSSVVHSSLWTEPDHVRLLFITLLALCDREGYVYGSRPGIERAANIEWNRELGLDPWTILMSPDPHSSDRLRSPENEGRRIEEVPGGFRLLNFEYYRGLRNDDDRREQNRAAQTRFREKSKRQSARVSQDKPASATVSQDKRISDAEAEADTEKTVRQRTRATEPPDPQVKLFLTWFQEEYTKKRNGAAYLVRWDKDGATVKRLLKATTLEKLKLFARIMLSDHTEDEFIVNSDRGIGVLAAKFNWLSDRLAAWEVSNAQKSRAQ